MITNEEKEMIRVRLGEYCEMKGSQKRAATSLVGVSPATVTQIVTGKWELINEKMWRSIAAQIGVKQTRWNIVETRNYRALSDIFADAQENALVLAVCGEAGTGKSLTAAHYGAENPNVYVLACSEYWNRKTFLRELLRVMGKNPAGDTVGDMVDDVVMELKRCENPLIILDEADKLSDQVMFFFITFYNKLEDYCGIVLMATDYLEKKVRRGLRLNQSGDADRGHQQHPDNPQNQDRARTVLPRDRSSHRPAALTAPITGPGPAALPGPAAPAVRAGRVARTASTGRTDPDRLPNPRAGRPHGPLGSV